MQRIRNKWPAVPTPLSLTDAQLTSLLEIAEQLHQIDRDPFLRAVADRFAGKSEIGEGEFARGLRELLRNVHFKWMQSKSAFTEPAA
jgi:hypothetical protein